MFFGGSMFSLNIQGDSVYFRDIKPEHLPQILNWYNKIEDFKFATGIDQPMTIEMLTQKYAEISICTNEFFVGIYSYVENKMIGILKGRLEYENKNTVWISSIVIDLVYQNKGYGSLSIRILIEHLKLYSKIKEAYLAVIEVNEQGRRFWSKNCFNEVRRIHNHIRLQNKQQNVIIMHRAL
jgi:RimJ/RimL family protein N-acetyltransferase